MICIGTKPCWDETLAITSSQVSIKAREAVRAAERANDYAEAEQIKEALENIQNVFRQARGLMEIWPEKALTLLAQAQETAWPFRRTIENHHRRYVQYWRDEDEEDEDV